MLYHMRYSRSTPPKWNFICSALSSSCNFISGDRGPHMPLWSWCIYRDSASWSWYSHISFSCSAWWRGIPFTVVLRHTWQQCGLHCVRESWTADLLSTWETEGIKSNQPDICRQGAELKIHISQLGPCEPPINPMIVQGGHNWQSHQWRWGTARNQLRGNQGWKSLRNIGPILWALCGAPKSVLLPSNPQRFFSPCPIPHQDVSTIFPATLQSSQHLAPWMMPVSSAHFSGELSWNLVSSPHRVRGNYRPVLSSSPTNWWCCSRITEPHLPSLCYLLCLAMSFFL